MAADQVLRLFDYYWFEHAFFFFTAKQGSSNPTKNPHLKEHEQLAEREPDLHTYHTPTLQVRSLSDQFLCSEVSFGSDSLSPDSVILKQKLRRIVSGKEIGDAEVPEIDSMKKECYSIARKGKRVIDTRSKSLSELEFEELKGFMDLGFVFSEEDKSSTLVSIIPGLQRFGRKAEEDEQANIDQPMISRPYLSEAWNIQNRAVTSRPLIDWRIQTAQNKTDIKDHLRTWAKNVASTVKM
ncbi:hypothetical protein NMG60_11032765 [Bertholletia excelsa]